eukprot:TRINITY_DN61697_c0_g1_i1.p1 TRINITY_DN61697_c0_g1~~TRINITY_DN61697_c0_g1_i1.p1  ORF type:complete len:368 (-),score=52.89 TRINITY_DN61697_c0_g1_i1:60-1163(-)
MDSNAGRVTIVITTSPIPSHPSPALLRALLTSLRTNLRCGDCHRLGREGGLQVLLVCDGYHKASQKPQLCSAEAYADFLSHVDAMVSAGDLGDSPTVLKLEACKGYGLALTTALQHVRTKYVLVVQHDWLFVRNVDLAPLVSAMDAADEVKYIGMQSITTLDYAKHMHLRYSIDLPPSRQIAGLRLVPQLLWYDKPHLCGADHYRDEVLTRAPMGVCECPERKYGVELMWREIRSASSVEQAHRPYGTFFWDAGEEIVYHLSGRKLQAADSGTVSAPADNALELHGAALPSRTYTAVAADRIAVVPGLAMPSCSASKQGQTSSASRFKGRCYLCGEKGHSKRLCSSRSEEATGIALERDTPAVPTAC